MLQTDTKFLQLLQKTITQDIFKVTITGNDRLDIYSQSPLTADQIDIIKNVLIKHKRKFSHYLHANRLTDGTMVLVAGSIWYQWWQAKKQ